MINLLFKYISDDSAATAVEYGLIGASIGVAISATVFFIGDEINWTFNYIITQLSP